MGASMIRLIFLAILVSFPSSGLEGSYWKSLDELYRTSLGRYYLTATLLSKAALNLDILLGL